MKNFAAEFWNPIELCGPEFLSVPQVYGADKLYKVRAVATIIRSLRTMAAPPQVEILIPYG